jgi:hypothetical protein
MLASWNGRTFLKVKKQLFCWESHWNMYRPIESISWNGDPIWADRDIFSSTFGFGSPEMKSLCETLTEKYSTSEDVLQLASIEALWAWSDYPLAQWLLDRRIVCCSCETPTKVSWNAFLDTHQLRRRTLKVHPLRNKVYTKHRLPK